MNEKGKQFYEFVKSKGVKVPDSYEDFQTRMQDKETATQFQSFVKSKGITVPDNVDEFQSIFVSGGGGADANFTEGSAQQSEPSTTTTSEEPSTQQEQPTEIPSRPTPLVDRGLPVGVASRRELAANIQDPYLKRQEESILNVQEEIKTKMSELPVQQVYDDLYKTYTPLLQEKERELQDAVNNNEITAEEANKQYSDYQKRVDDIVSKRTENNPKLQKQIQELRSEASDKLFQEISQINQEKKDAQDLAYQQQIEELSPLESIGNSLYNAGLMTSLIPAKTMLMGEQLSEDFTFNMPIALYSTLTGTPRNEEVEQIIREGTQSVEAQQSAYKQIKDAEAKLKPTLPFLDSIEEGEVADATAAAVGTAVDFARSIVTGAATLGAGTYGEIGAPMYIQAVEQKAKDEGITPEEVIAGDLEDETTAILSGALAGAAEAYGLGTAAKFMKNAVFKQAVKDQVKRNTPKLLSAAKDIATQSVKETGTEVFQGAVEEANQAALENGGITTDAGRKAFLNKAIEASVSRQAAETGATTFAGSVLLFGMGKGTGALKTAVTATNSDFESLTDEQVIEIIDAAQDKDAIKETIKGLYESGNITEQQYNTAVDNVNKALELEGKTFADFTPDAKKKSIELIRKKERLEKEIEGKDDALAAPKKEEIKQIEEQLTAIANGQTTQESQEAQTIEAQDGQTEITDGREEEVSGLEQEDTTGEQINEEDVQKEEVDRAESLSAAELDAIKEIEEGKVVVFYDEMTEGGVVVDNGADFKEAIKVYPDFEILPPDQIDGNEDIVSWENVKTKETDAVQEQETEGVDVRQQAEAGEEVEQEVREQDQTEVEKPSQEAIDRAKEFGYNAPREVRNAARKYLGKPENVRVEDLTDEELQSIQKARVDNEIDNIERKVKDKLSDKADPAKTNKRIFDDTLAYLQGTKWYENASDTQRESAVRDLMTRYEQKIPKSASLKKILAPKQAEKKITQSERVALKKQIRDFARGAKFGSQEQRKVGQNISKYVRDLKLNGKLSAQQATSIAQRAAKVNFGNPKSAAEFVDFADKVAADSEYANKLSTAQKAKARTKKLSKSKALPVNVRTRLEEASKIDPRYVDDIDLYIAAYEDLLAAATSPTNKSYKPLNDNQAAERLEKLKEQADNGRKNRILEENEYLGDLDMSLEELESFLESESADEFEQSLSEAKRKTLRDRVRKLADYAMIGLDEYTPSAEVSKKNKRRLSDLRNLNLDELSLAELRDFIRVSDNIVNNESFDGVVALSAKSVAQADASTFLNKLPTQVKNNIRALGKLESETLSLPSIMKKIFSEKRAAALFRLYSGLQDFFSNAKKAQDSLDALNESFSDLVKQIKKKGNKDITNYENNIFRGVASYFVQGRGFLVEQHLARIKDDPTLKKEYDATKRAYDKLSPFETPEDVVKYLKENEADNWRLMQKFADFFSGIKDDLRDTKQEVHNEKFEEAGGEVYLPTKQMSYLESADDIGADDNFSVSPQKVQNPKAAANTIARQENATLGRGRKLNLQFDSLMFNVAGQDLLDINTAEDIAKMRAFLGNSDIQALFTPQTTKHLIQRINEIINNKRGVTTPIEEWQRVVVDATRLLRKIAYTIGLGSVMQYPKQYASVILNSALNLGRDSRFLFDMNIPMDAPIFDEYSIGERGKTRGGLERGETLSAAQQREIVGRFDKVIRGIESTTEPVRDALFAGLRAGDTHVAKRSWAAYYKSYLYKNGYDISKIDWKTEHLNPSKLQKEAAAFAEQAIGETQVPSEFSELPQILKSTGNPLKDILKNILFPYSTFTINAKGRMYNDVKILGNSGTTPEQKKEAAKSLGGTLAEIVAFQALSVFILAQLRKLGKEGLMWLFDVDMDEDEEEREDALEFKIKKFYSNVIRDIFVSGFSGIVEKGFIDGLNTLSYWIGAGLELEGYTKGDGTRISKKEFEKIKPFYRYSEDVVDLGLYEMPFDMEQEVWRSFDMGFGGENEIEVNTKYGYKTITLGEEQRDFMKMVFVMELLQAAGLNDAELARMFSSGKREILMYGDQAGKIIKRRDRRLREVNDNIKKLTDKLLNKRITEEKFGEELQKYIAKVAETQPESLEYIDALIMNHAMNYGLDIKHITVVAARNSRDQATQYFWKFGKDKTPQEIQEQIANDPQFQQVEFEPDDIFFMEYQRLQDEYGKK